MKKFLMFLFVFVTMVSVIYAQSVPKVSGWTDLLRISKTVQTTIATTTQLLSNGGVLILNVESSDLPIRLGSDTTCLTNGILIDGGSSVYFRFSEGQRIYVDATQTTPISYLTGE